MIQHIVRQTNLLAMNAAIEAFNKTVAEQEHSIKNAMEEQTAGNKQVPEAIRILNDITWKVQESSAEMLTGSNQIITETGNLNAMPQEITLGMDEMSGGSTATKIVGLIILSHDAISDILPGK